MNRAATRPSDVPSPLSVGSTETVSLPGRFIRAGMVLGICAALGMSILGGPHAATSRHSTASVSIHLAAHSIARVSPSVTGGPGTG